MLQLGILSRFSVCSVPWMCGCVAATLSFKKIQQSLVGFSGKWHWSPGCGQAGPTWASAQQGRAIWNWGWSKAGWSVEALCSQEELGRVEKVGDRQRWPQVPNREGLLCCLVCCECWSCLLWLRTYKGINDGHWTSLWPREAVPSLPFSLQESLSSKRDLFAVQQIKHWEV